MFLVTGASGFIGRATVAALARRGVPVVAAARHMLDMEKPIQTVRVTSYSELKPPEADCVLLHLAEPRNIGPAEDIGSDYVAARRALLADLLAKHWGHVVYASSAAVYDDNDATPHRTSEEIAPRGTYAKAKATCEQDVLERGGAVARLSNVYGPGMAPNNVVSDILRQVPGEGPLTIQNRRPVRDYLWIDDAAEGLAVLATSRKAGVFNFGTGVGTSVEVLAHTALAGGGQPGRAVRATEEAERSSHLVLDISATTQQLGWTPQVGLAQGLKILLGVA
jgi:UDP-glucose 4-epimerase